MALPSLPHGFTTWQGAPCMHAGFSRGRPGRACSSPPISHWPGPSHVATANASEPGKRSLAGGQERAERLAHVLPASGLHDVIRAPLRKSNCEFSPSKPKVSDLLTLPRLLQWHDQNQIPLWQDVTSDVGCGKQTPGLKSNGLIH